jgi:hypothetical protein
MQLLTPLRSRLETNRLAATCNIFDQTPQLRDLPNVHGREQSVEGMTATLPPLNPFPHLPSPHPRHRRSERAGPGAAHRRRSRAYRHSPKKRLGGIGLAGAPEPKCSDPDFDLKS